MIRKRFGRDVRLRRKNYVGRDFFSVRLRFTASSEPFDLTTSAFMQEIWPAKMMSESPFLRLKSWEQDQSLTNTWKYFV